MSFGPSQETKNAMNAQQGASQQAVANSNTEIGAGNNLLNQGGQNVMAGSNYLSTLLNGNAANTAAMLQPNIDQINQANNNTVASSSALMPRGGGRYGALFSSTYAPNQQIQSLFNGARSNAAGALAQLGISQQGIGSSLFGTGNQALGTGLQGYGALTGESQTNTQLKNQVLGGLGQTLFGLATMPFGLGNFGLGSATSNAAAAPDYVPYSFS